MYFHLIVWIIQTQAGEKNGLSWKNGGERIELELVNIDKVTVQRDKQRGLMALNLCSEVHWGLFVFVYNALIR